MCGIAGYLNMDGAPAEVEKVEPMTNAISHRGPDGEGQWIDGVAALGHRRLAILDLSEAGSQPMLTPDGRFAITYNGELYNYRELRVELEVLGHAFQSQSDTEVVLQAFAEWGEEALARFNGMFAFAIWDKIQQELFIARDRYGIKPLYWSQSGNVFAFGSEIKAITAHPAFQREIDKRGLFEYFTFQNFFSQRTLFRGMSMFPAGHWWRLSPSAKPKSSPTQYWDFHFQIPDSPGTQTEYVEELDRLFQQAVSRQLVSDVEVGAYLSGGIDSGSITAAASREIPNIKSFTCGFDLHGVSELEYGFDERSNAEYLSHLFQTEHYEVVLKSGDMERCLPEYAYHLEEPRVGQSYPNWYVSKLASKFVKVVLSGTGGDELFAGYPWRYFRAAVNDDFEQYVSRYYSYWQRMLNDEERRNIFAPIWEGVNGVKTSEIFENVFGQRPSQLETPEEYINQSLYFEAKTFLHGLLVVEDKLSMAHGLESRVPFLDNDLVDFAQKLPVNLKLKNLREIVRIDENAPRKDLQFFKKSKDGKQIFREMAERHLPERVVSADKQGFSAPDGSWFQNGRIRLIEEKLMTGNAEIFQFLDPKAVQQLVGEHLSGQRNRRLFVWSLLNVETLLNQS